MSEFKRKCEVKIKDIKAKYQEDLGCKEKIISDIKGELAQSRKEHEIETKNLTAVVSFGCLMFLYFIGLYGN